MVKRNFSRVKTQCILSFVLKELCRFTAFMFRTSLLVISASLEYLCFHVSDQFSYQPSFLLLTSSHLISLSHLIVAAILSFVSCCGLLFRHVCVSRLTVCHVRPVNMNRCDTLCSSDLISSPHLIFYIMFCLLSRLVC